jgi:hypothetical protein
MGRFCPVLYVERTTHMTSVRLVEHGTLDVEGELAVAASFLCVDVVLSSWLRPHSVRAAWDALLAVIAVAVPSHVRCAAAPRPRSRTSTRAQV